MKDDLRAAALLLLTASIVLSGTMGIVACDSTSADPGDDAGAPAPSSCRAALPASQPLSGPCCAEWGIDACGAGLFCEAFDGRTQPTCYAERSRRPFQSCSAGIQCVSGDCDMFEKTCRSSSPGGSCIEGDACARDGLGVPHACVGGRCVAAPCDPIEQTGCEGAEACDLVGNAAGCRLAGAAAQTQTCGGGHRCVAGNTCVGQCRRICRSELDCAVDTVCTKTATREYGYCSPVSVP